MFDTFCDYHSSKSFHNLRFVITVIITTIIITTVTIGRVLTFLASRRVLHMRGVIVCLVISGRPETAITVLKPKVTIMALLTVKLVIMAWPLTRGRMYKQWISSSIAFIFYPPFILKKKKKTGMFEACLGLSGRPKRVWLFIRFSTFKQPKIRIKMAASRCCHYRQRLLLWL